MAATTPPDASRLQRALDAFVMVVLVLVLAWQLAYWTWVFLTPPATDESRESSPAVDLAAIARLFGGAPPAGSTTASTSGLRLKGVIAPTPGVAASAIFSTGTGKDLAVYVGREVQPGVKLTAVYPDHVTLSRNGVEERIDLEAMRGGKSSAPGASRGPGFRVNVARSGENNYSFSRKELDEALRDPGQLNYLGQIGVPPGGGVRMDAAPAGSLAAKLGLRPGDVIKKVNGQTVTSTGDLARLYQQFATINTITAEVQRGGSTVTLNYQIQ